MSLSYRYAATTSSYCCNNTAQMLRTAVVGLDSIQSAEALVRRLELPVEIIIMKGQIFLESKSFFFYRTLIKLSMSTKSSTYVRIL